MTSKFYLNVILTAIAFELLVLTFNLSKMNVSKGTEQIKNLDVSQAKYETPREFDGSQTQVLNVRIVGIAGEGYLPVRLNASTSSIQVLNGLNAGKAIPLQVQVVQK